MIDNQLKQTISIKDTIFSLHSFTKKKPQGFPLVSKCMTKFRLQLITGVMYIVKVKNDEKYNKKEVADNRMNRIKKEARRRGEVPRVACLETCSPILIT